MMIFNFEPGFWTGIDYVIHILIGTFFVITGIIGVIFYFGDAGEVVSADNEYFDE